MDDADRSNLLGGNYGMAGSAATAKSRRISQINKAVEDSEGVTPAQGAASAPSQSASGVNFFNGSSATPAQKAAKQKALLEKLRARGD